MDIPAYRGRGPGLTDQVTSLISEVYNEDFNQTAKEVMVEVHKRLKGKQLRPGWPGLSAIQKGLTEIRKNIDDRPPELKGLDGSWSIGTLTKTEYNIPPEALPVVLQVWANRLKEAKPDKDGFSVLYQTFSIRDALWVSRLSHLFKDPEAIWSYAVWYSVRERAYEAIGKDPDTSDLDTQVLRLLNSKRTNKKKGGGKP
jgi:hypothetical protein